MLKKKNITDKKNQNKLIIDKKFFIEQNQFDYILYNYAIKLSKRQLSAFKNLKQT